MVYYVHCKTLLIIFCVGYEHLYCYCLIVFDPYHGFLTTLWICSLKILQIFVFEPGLYNIVSLNFTAVNI